MPTKSSRLVRLAILNDHSNFVLNETSNTTFEIIGGYEAPFLQLILDALHLIPTQILQDGQWGLLRKDGNWTGLVGKVSRDEVDFAIGSVFMTDERMKVVQFSYPYNIHQLTFATKAPGIRSASTALILPFPPSMWLAILISLIMFTIVVHLFVKKLSLIQCGIVLLGILLGQSADEIDHRILVSCWMTGSMILSKVYSSFLLTFLFFPLREIGVRDVYELSKAVTVGTHSCYVPKDSSVVPSLKTSKQEKLNIIADAIQKNDWYLHKREEYIRQLKNKNTAVVRTRQFFRSLFLDDIFVSEDYFYIGYTAILVRNNLSLKEELDVLVHRVRCSGLYEKLLDHYFFRNKLKYDASKRNETKDAESEFVKPLTLEHLYGAFLVLFGGNSLACLVYGFEVGKRILQRRKIRNVQETN